MRHYSANTASFPIKQGRLRVSVPGRLELIGNHTDHQGGCVISAALNRRICADAKRTDSLTIRADMGEFGCCEVALDEANWKVPRPEERGTSAALIRGMAAWGVRCGWQPCGFAVRVTSDLPAGGGVSSSAAFEVLMGTIVQTLWSGCAPADDDELMTLALGAVDAERTYFGKACGAQDQIACALGGVLYMDFLTEFPQVERLSADFNAAGYALVLVDSRVSHTPFTAEYERVPADMTRVARFLGAKRLGDVSAEELAAHAHAVQEVLGVRAFRRAQHFYDEVARVRAAAAALGAADAAGAPASASASAAAGGANDSDAVVDGVWRYVQLADASGRSSELLLQNVIPVECTSDEAAVIEPLQRILDVCAAQPCAYRIHGGGFGGCVLAIMPRERYDAFEQAMDVALGCSACMRVGVSAAGVVVEAHEADADVDAGANDGANGDVRVDADDTEAGVSSAVRTATAIQWQAPSAYGELELSINLAKPEKDPRDIAAAARTETARAEVARTEAATAVCDPACNPVCDPACDLCRENAQWCEERERVVNPALSATEFDLDDEVWRIHFSPYAYFREHCIIMTYDHHPMHISEAGLRRLLACVDLFSDYFVGSNADLPLVGGSILAHDHFQGGRHVFPLMKARVEREILLPARLARKAPGKAPTHAPMSAPTHVPMSACELASSVTCGLVRWPATVFRFAGDSAGLVVHCAATLLDAWRHFDFPPAGIVGQGHSTVTPIAYRADYATDFAADLAADLATDSAAASGGADTRTALDHSHLHSHGGYVLDVVLRNNGTDEEHPWGLFHPGPQWHHVKKENIGLIEIMGLAILPPRVLEGFPDVCENAKTRLQLAQAYEAILQATGVFPRDNAGMLTAQGAQALDAFLDFWEQWIA